MNEVWIRCVREKGLFLNCSQSPIFPWDRRCWSLSTFDGAPSWSIDTNETGESTNCSWVGLVGLMAWEWRGEPLLPTPTHGYFLLSPVSLASIDQNGGPSNSTISRKIGDCEQVAFSCPSQFLRNKPWGHSYNARSITIYMKKKLLTTGPRFLPGFLASAVASFPCPSQLINISSSVDTGSHNRDGVKISDLS